MPHFVLDCSQELLSRHGEATINARVHEAASESGLFDPAGIQVRVRPFADALVGGEAQFFVQVFAHVLEGRTQEQKAMLARLVLRNLVALFPDVEAIGMDILEVSRDGAFRRDLLE